MREEDYREKRDFEGDLGALFDQVAKDYQLGGPIGSQKVEMGYEDSNYVLETIIGKHFVKIFGSYRDEKECQRYIGIIETALSAGVNHPKLYRGKQGALEHSESGAKLAVFEHIDGQTFYEMGREPDEEESKEIVRQAALINSVDYKPDFVYDEWAITSIEDQYKIAEEHLSDEEKKSIERLLAEFREVDLKSLPHSLVHGDLITTNVMKSKDGQIFVYDFACANYQPRIMELAVLLCNLLRDKDYEFVVSEYQKHLELTDDELKTLPLFVNLAHAMHIVGAVRERDLHGNESDENDYWLTQGHEVLGIK